VAECDPSISRTTQSNARLKKRLLQPVAVYTSDGLLRSSQQAVFVKNAAESAGRFVWQTSFLYTKTRQTANGSRLAGFAYYEFDCLPYDHHGTTNQKI